MNIDVPTSLKRARVLVVDDVAVNRMIAAAVLCAEGYRCEEASSVDEALTLLRTGSYDALVLDLDFGPNAKGGLDLLETLRSERRWDSLQVIVLTSHLDAQVACFDVGACDYISKPFEPGVLSARLGRRLRERARVEGLVSSNREAWGELAEAAAVQRACRPAVPSVHGGVAVSGAVLSRTEVGGDLFDVVEDAKGRVTVMVVDVAGHGAAAAVVASSVRVAARTALERGGELAQVLGAIQACLRGYTGVLEANAAVGLARFDESARSVEIVNAGLPPIVLHADGQYTTVSSMGPPIGFVRQPRWIPRVCELRAGDALAMFTDGATQQKVSSEDATALAETFGLARFGAALALAPYEQFKKLIDETPSTSTRDDATVVVAGLLLS